MKKKHGSVWDNVAFCFAVNGGANIYAPGAENFEAIWPILQPIIVELSVSGSLNVSLDFGCGTGMFAEAISAYCQSTYACDSSEQMLSMAIEKSSGKTTYGLGSVDFVRRCPPLSLITAIMVFQFIDNIEETIRVLCEATANNGIIFFATHDLDYVNECLLHHCKFRHVLTHDQQLLGEISINKHWINTYVRSERVYETIFNKYGFKKVSSIKAHIEPPLELDKSIPWKSSKYYIAWYKKENIIES